MDDASASVEERVESLQELCETLTPRESSCLATDQLRESDETQETQAGDPVFLSDWWDDIKTRIGRFNILNIKKGNYKISIF